MDYLFFMRIKNMVEMAMRDMAALNLDKKRKAMCFSDIIGSDLDGSFRDSLTYLQTSATSEISIGGQPVSGGG